MREGRSDAARKQPDERADQNDRDAAPLTTRTPNV